MGGLEAVFIVDRTLRVVQWSGGAAALTGVPVKDALGRPCHDILQGRDAFGHSICGSRCPAFGALQQGLLPGPAPLFVRCKNGPPLRLQCELIASPLTPSQVVVCLHSKKSFRPAELELRQAASPNPSLLSGMVRDLSALLALTTTLSVPSQGSLELALDVLRDVTGAEAAELFLAEPKGWGMVLTYFRGPFKRAFFQVTSFKSGQGFPGMVVEYQEPILTRDLPADPRYLRTRVKEKGFHSYLCVPIHEPRGIMGSINLAFRRPNADLEKALAILSWASAPLSMRLQADLQQLWEKANTYDLDTDDGSEGELGGALNRMVRSMVSLAGAQGGAINLLHPKGKGLVWRVREGAIPTSVCPTLQNGASQACPALAESRGIALYGARRSWPLSCQQSPRLGSVTYCIPTALGGEVVDLLQVAYQDPSPEPPTRNLVWLERVAESAARSVRDAWEYAEGRRQAKAVFRGWLEKDLLSPLAPDKAHQEDGTEVIPYLDIRCFGPLELYCRGTLVTPDMVQRRKVLTLLKILLTYDGRPVAKDTLIELLWPEAEPEAGASRLYVVVHALRRLVEPPGRSGKWVFIQNEGDRYYFNTQASCRIDVREFKALLALGKKTEATGNTEAAMAAYEAAAQLYRGDFLEDEPFAEWCWMEREELREVCLDTAKRLATLYAQAGELEQGVKHLRHALRLDPLREEFHRELIRHLWALGRRDEALRQYDTCRNLLQRELGVEPLPETQQLLRRLRGLPQ